MINNNNIFSNIYIVLDGSMEMGDICEERLEMGELVNKTMNWFVEGLSF